MSKSIPPHSCFRCGVSTTADYCGDCKRVDPDFCEGGKSSRERYAHLVELNRRWNEFNSAIRRASGRDGVRERSRAS